MEKTQKSSKQKRSGPRSAGSLWEQKQAKVVGSFVSRILQLSTWQGELNPHTQSAINTRGGFPVP